MAKVSCSFQDTLSPWFLSACRLAPHQIETEIEQVSKIFQNFKRPFTPRKHIHWPRKLGKTCFRRFPTFNAKEFVWKKFFGPIKKVSWVFHLDFVDLEANGSHHQPPLQMAGHSWSIWRGANREVERDQGENELTNELTIRNQRINERTNERINGRTEE